MADAGYVRKLLVGAALAALLLSGCDLPDVEAGTSTGPATSTKAKPPADKGDTDAVRQLDALSVGEWSTARYNRDRFDHWSSQGEGCDTRDAVLRRAGKDVVVADDCKIVSGTWVSVYDDVTVTDPQDLDIDHMVPLANAWRTGAHAWTPDEREEFANDLDRPQLLAVTAKTNRSKGDKDPSEWKPPRRDYWCAYAESWIAVKTHWKLRVTTAEKQALTDMLATCA